MKLRSCNKRRRRNFWKRKGHTHLMFNRGIWLRPEIIDPTGEFAGFAQQTITGAYQPNAYRHYP